jgi:hypothetical protein
MGGNVVGLAAGLRLSSVSARNFNREQDLVAGHPPSGFPPSASASVGCEDKSRGQSKYEKCLSLGSSSPRALAFSSNATQFSTLRISISISGVS